MMDEGMTEGQQTVALIEEYTRLQRIKTASDRDKEIDYQIKTTKAKLKVFGIVAENLDK